MSKVKAEWTVELNVNCPEFNHLFDITEVDDFWAGAEAGEHETPRTTDFECCCPECDHEFTCDFTYRGGRQMSTNKQALRNSADRDWFEEWFKKEYHPNKTGSYIKDQMFFAIQAARAPLLDELEAAHKSNEFLKEQLAQLASFNPDWDKLEAATDSIREHMVELIAARNRIAELEKGHCGAPLLEREEAHVKTVSGLLAELGKWQQESSTWQSVAEKQLTIAIEAEKRIAELEKREPDLYLCRVVRNGEHVYSPCGKDYPRGQGYYAAGITVKGDSE